MDKMDTITLECDTNHVGNNPYYFVFKKGFKYRYMRWTEAELFKDHLREMGHKVVDNTPAGYQLKSKGWM